MRIVCLLIGSILLASIPAYADIEIPFSGDFSGDNSIVGGSYTTFSGSGFSASIEMIDTVGFSIGPRPDGYAAGDTLSIFAPFINGTASVTETPCFSQVTCSGAHLRMSYDGLNYETVSFFSSQSSTTTVNLNVGMMGSMIVPADVTAPNTLLIPISLTGTLRFMENGVTTNVITLTGTGIASVTAFYMYTAEDRGAVYDIGSRASMSFTGTATDPSTAVPEPSHWCC